MPKGAPDYYPWSGATRRSATGGATIFEQTITIPRNTAAGSPVSQDITLCKGFVTAGEVIIPPGCAGLVGVAIFDQATQLYPGTAATWVTGDNADVYFDTDYDVPLVSAAYKLTIKGFNDDDTYSHKPIIRLWVVKYP